MYILCTYYVGAIVRACVTYVQAHAGNVCQARVLQGGLTIENGRLMKKCRKWATSKVPTSIAFSQSLHSSCDNHYNNLVK